MGSFLLDMKQFTEEGREAVLWMVGRLGWGYDWADNILIVSYPLTDKVLVEWMFEECM